MFLQKQDIINLKNIIYKDNGKIDLSITGHPVLVIHVTETHFYYLTISSSSNRTPNKNIYQHFMLRKNKDNRLRAPMNYINLKNIYKQEIKNYVPFGFVNDALFNKIMNDLKNYQENINEDKLYLEINKVKKLSLKHKLK